MGRLVERVNAQELLALAERLRRIARLVRGGALVIGGHESLPDGQWLLVRDRSELPVLWKVQSS